ncbi:hypothetical protein [Mobiluncus mulieris]|uniref:hypothetical protein n=1 Tax=Mobiluncus mulieris TaxID=2052 RepID=UPI00215D7FEF|nr:hypothetical protein [Mobiluncus mulieris]
MNYNAGTLGAHISRALVPGVTVDGHHLGGGCFHGGNHAIGVHQRVSLGRNCHLGANSGGDSPGDECVIEPGCI